MITFNKTTNQGSKFNRFLTSWFGRPVHMAVEFTLINKVRSFSDGIDFLKLSFSSDTYKDDHTPRVFFMFTILNVNIVEFGLYNINHYNWHEGFPYVETVEAPYKVE